jgi:hypothetical protein
VEERHCFGPVQCPDPARTCTRHLASERECGLALAPHRNKSEIEMIQFSGPSARLHSTTGRGRRQCILPNAELSHGDVMRLGMHPA